MDSARSKTIDYNAGYAAGVRELVNWLEHNAVALRMTHNTSLKSIIRLCVCIATSPDKLMRYGSELAVHQDDTGKVRRYYLID